MVNVTIDGIAIQVEEGTTILEAARKAGIHIPTLCYWKDLNEIAACRVCVVEVEGFKRLFTACNNVVTEGMVVKTNSEKARKARTMNVQLILSEHNTACTTCVRSGNCSLQSVANELNLIDNPYGLKLPPERGNKRFPLIRDYQKCITCLRCIQVCDNQACHVWDLVGTGTKVHVDVREALRVEDAKCSLCGQCITHCPTGALRTRDDTDVVLEAVHDPERITVIQIAPSIRTAWGEGFGMDNEEATVERLASALHLIGFDYVFDTDFSADLTIMEEASEFLERIAHKDTEKFPMFTSCCPGWVRFTKGHHPELVDQLSTSKSPQQMFGAIAKSYYAELLHVDPKKIFVVSLMPCVAKKHECALPNMNDACGDPDVDIVLTNRELIRLIKSEGIDPKEIPDRELDHPLGIGSGAGNIFGATGGVMEAALRSAYYFATGKNPDPDNTFKDVRGMDGWKEATFDFAGTPLHVAVANGLGNAEKLIQALAKGEVHYDFVEVMACPGGCVGGGGQPIHDGEERAAIRAVTLYDQDKANHIRFCHENPSIVAVYKDYLEKPLSERAHHLLHTDHHDWKMPGEE